MRLFRYPALASLIGVVMAGATVPLLAASVVPGRAPHQAARPSTTAHTRARHRRRRPAAPKTGPAAARTGGLVKPVVGLRIRSSVRLTPGTYDLTDDGGGALQITGYDIVVDCTGVKVRGNGRGLGVHIVNARNVTLRGLDVSHYLWGVDAENSSGIVIENCTASRNADLPAATIISESGELPEDNHGGGFLFRDCHHTRILRSVAQHEWDGLDLVRCDNNTFRDNDFSYLNNWGLHLWSSSHNTFAGNRCVWCTTGEGHDFQGSAGAATYDSAAVLIEHDSAYNLIEGNDLRSGGDGIFIRCNQGPSAPGAVFPRPHPSDHNIVQDNDCSFSPNNAIEADFCDDNRFIHNNCSASNYGFWLGYSRRAIVQDNTVVGCTARAVQIENGQQDTLRGNTFINNTASPAASLVYLYQNGRDTTPSGPYSVLQNVFVGSSRPVELAHTPVTASGNRLVVSSAQIFSADKFSPVKDSGGATASGAALPVITTITPDPASVGAALPTPAMPLSLEAATGRRVRLAPSASATPEQMPGSSIVVISGRHLASMPGQPVVLVNDNAATVLASAPGRIVIAIPYDFWNRDVPAVVTLKVFNGETFGAPLPLQVVWSSSRPRIEAIQPSPAAPGSPVTITGEHLAGPGGSAPVLYLDGAPVRVAASSPTAITFSAPGGLLTSRGYNLQVRAGSMSYPVAFHVTVPPGWEPHIISARFTPTHLKVGDLLHVEAVIKNNAPFTLSAAEPHGGHIYGEDESYQSQHFAEQLGLVYLRVTSDLKDGSWPYLWGFSENLPPGETQTVDGYIRVITPGVTEYRVGLVDGLVRWIDDGLYRTPITVTPAP